MTSSLDLVLFVSWVLIDQESFFDVGVLNLKVGGEDGLFDEEFFVTYVDLLQTDGLFDGLDGLLDLVVESLAGVVGDDSQVWVTSPGFEGFLVEGSSGFDTF